MNERINELAKQSLPAFYLTNCPSALEKFAELIVQKCADIGERYADGNYEVRNQILQHFGLEEPEE
jgi:hypothetical protein